MEREDVQGGRTNGFHEVRLGVTGDTLLAQGHSYGQAVMAHRKYPDGSRVRNALGPGIRQARERKGWSQSDLARELQLLGWDVDRTLIARIELKRRCVTDMELLLLAEVLEATLDFFARAAGDRLSSGGAGHLL